MDGIRTWLLVCALAAAIGSAGAMEPPLTPFETYDPSTYGSDLNEPHEGYFFSFEGLYMSLNAPDVTSIGVPGGRVAVADFIGTREQTNSLDTGLLTSEFTEGNRVEFGKAGCDGGWIFSTFRLTGWNQEIVGNDVDVVFDDPVEGIPGIGLLDGFIDGDLDGFDDDRNSNGDFGRFTDTDNDGVPDTPLLPQDVDFLDMERLPVTFSDLEARNSAKLWGVELMRLWRLNPMHRGGIIEIMAGARFAQFDEKFRVIANGGVLANSDWDTEAENNMVGPQLAARWFKRKGRWILAVEGRWFAAFNLQNIYQRGHLASELAAVPDPGSLDRPANLPFRMTTRTFTHSLHEEEFSPAVELRAKASFMLTESISFQVGWTGMYFEGIARPSNMIDYRLPDMGLVREENRQEILLNGLTIGIEINR